MNELFAREALTQIPKILTLQDRNPHSPTYGCFDRNYWHYKIIDFPSGMAQEFVWPLALAWDCDLAGNDFFRREVLRDWVEAGILFAARSAHSDGSCDDYFPFEKAGGATAFSLLACVESYRLLGLENAEMREFFRRRANWLAHHHESGQLTNHQALIVLCLQLVSRILDQDLWPKEIRTRLDCVLAWQNPEGWFQEYEGCDPGYHTLTIGLLAQIDALTPAIDLRPALAKAVRFAAEFVHPDGSFGGEYASRNTYNFFPHGFEIVAGWLPEATAINDQFLLGLQNGLAPCYADDHIIGHHTWSYLLAARHFAADRAPVTRPGKSIHYPNAGLAIDRRAGCELYVALNKGGVFKFFREGKLIVSDTQLSLQIFDHGKVRNAVGHLVSRYDVALSPDELSVAGTLGWAKEKKMTPLRMIALRVLMLSVGRFFPDLIRKLLQKMLITGKVAAAGNFHRTISWRGGQLHVRDELRGVDWTRVKQAGIGGAQTSIYVVMSRTFQAGQLQRWNDLTGQVRQLAAEEPLAVERIY